MGNTLAQAVHRGADGSVHYLASSVEGSLLIVTDPALGVRRIPLDGLCRLAKSDGDSVQYESIGTDGATRAVSTTVWIRPGAEALINTIGVCIACAFPSST